MADGGSSANWVSVLIGVAGGGISGIAAWWRSTRVARVQADDAAWQRVNDTIVAQQRDLDSTRARAEKAERGLRQAGLMVDRLTGLLDTNGVTIPAHLQVRPWENGNGTANGNGTPPKEGS